MDGDGFARETANACREDTPLWQSALVYRHPHRSPRCTETYHPYLVDCLLSRMTGNMARSHGLTPSSLCNNAILGLPQPRSLSTYTMHVRLHCILQHLYLFQVASTSCAGHSIGRRRTGYSRLWYDVTTEAQGIA